MPSPAGSRDWTSARCWKGQRRYIEQSDLAICHQETPVALPGGPFSAYPSFNVPPQIAAAAKAVGYRACTTASNHTIDQGTEGLVQDPGCAGCSRAGAHRLLPDAG